MKKLSRAAVAVKNIRMEVESEILNYEDTCKEASWSMRESDAQYYRGMADAGRRFIVKLDKLERAL